MNKQEKQRSIEISEDTYYRLRCLLRPYESIDGLINRLITSLRRIKEEVGYY